MKLAPAIAIHGLSQADAALAAGRKLTLLSARNAAVFAGVGWWQALVATALRRAPAGMLAAGMVFDVLDCGAAPGRALEALRAGQRLLILRADGEIFADLAARAARQGATLLAERPPALDLVTFEPSGPPARASARAARLAAWLDRPA